MIRSALLVASALLLAASAHADPTVPADLAVFGDGGLRVGGQVLFQGEVAGAALDTAQDLVWFTSKGTVQVIDLRDPTRTPVVIIDQMEGASVQVTGFSSAEINTVPSSTFLSLALGKKPRLHGEKGIYAEVDEDAAKHQLKALKKAKLVGAAWIKAQLGRKPRAIAAPAARPAPAAVALPPGMGHCEDTGGCGNATWLAGTPYQLVVVMGACGDACYEGCALYDPAKKVFAGLGDSATWGPMTDDIKNVGCTSVATDPSGGRYFVESAVCTIDAKQLACTDLKPWTAFGWITTPPAGAH
jgi:hypothetical protein